MQEIKKRRILLASVLKPVDEPRALERMAQSLAANGVEVFITGFPPSNAAGWPGTNEIQFIPHKNFSRISIARIKARFSILRKALSIKPDIFIISTHELIGVAILFKLFTGRKIVYDVQENYWMNIMYTNAWPKLIRPLIAFPLRWKERITAPFFSKFLLAEKCYEDELPFTTNKSVVIQNKCHIPPGFERRPRADCIQLLFTGLIAESTGIFEAIDLAKKLHMKDPRIQLTILGQCSQQKTLQRLEREISESPFIMLTGGKDFVAHEEIMEAISTAHFGIISYPPSPHTQKKIPSKLYEYLACRLPILLQNNNVWVDLCKSTDAAIVVDFNRPDAASVLRQMNEGRFFKGDVSDANWQTEEKKLLHALESI